ncbi:MAG: peptide ABC transporter substrate-binding protein [Anaerolineales bacterium]
MQKLRWQLLIVLLALAIIAALLLGEQPTVLQPEIGTTPAPASGGAYTEALIGAPGRFNPTLDFYNPIDRDVNRLIFSALVRFDDRGLPQPDLAESWGVTRDGTTYNFAIRPNAIWHDGAPVTAQDVIFTIELLRDPNYPVREDVRALWQTIDVRLLDDLTVQFRLPEPFAPFLDYLTFGILPRHLLSNTAPADLVNHPFNLAPVGSGPFAYESLLLSGETITGVTLRAFEGYYGGRPLLDTFTFRYYPDAESALAAYRTAEVDGISQIPLDILTQALAEPELNLYTGRLPQTSMILFNLQNADVPFLQESSVRRALLMGLNRQWMIDSLLQGQAILAHGPVFPGTWAYFENTPQIAYNPNDATTLLRRAGYTIPAEGGNVRAKEGVALAFELLHPDDAQHTALAEAIQADWARLGVQITLKAVPYTELIQNYLVTHNYQAVLLDVNLAGSPDPDPYPFWHQAQIAEGQNYAQWDDRQASEYLEQARITVDLQERARLYGNFQVRFANELPALPLFYPVYRYGVAARIGGVSMGPLFDPADRLNGVTQWYVKP